MKISIKLRVFSDGLFVSSHGRRGGGGGYTGGLMVRAVGNSGVGGNSAVGGGGNRGGGQQWGCRQPLRTALHNISIKVQVSKTV